MTAKLPNQLRVSNTNKLELFLFTLFSAFLPSSIVLWQSLFLLPFSVRPFSLLLSLPVTGCQTPDRLQGLSAPLPQLQAKERCFPAPPSRPHGPPVLFADADTVRLSISCTLELGFNLRAAEEAACEHVQPSALSYTSSGSRRYSGINSVPNLLLLASAWGAALSWPVLRGLPCQSLLPRRLLFFLCLPLSLF